MTTFKDVFISYGRADSKAFASQLSERLSEAGISVWFDFNDIPFATDFQERINDGIERAHSFLYIISPSSVNSIYCGKELELALRYRKRIIPLMHVEEISFQTWLQRNPEGTELEWQAFKESGKQSSLKNLNQIVSKLNWVIKKDSWATKKYHELPGLFCQVLVGLIRQDQVYVQRHTQLLTQALDWKRHHRQTRYLLVGSERQHAETWLKSRLMDNALPFPSPLHCEFITESIKNANNLMTQVFLCHSDKDKKSAAQIRWSLLRRGITVWNYSTDIQTSQDYNSAIAQGIEEADNIIFILSPHSARSTYCQHELDQALKLHKRVIPVLATPVEPQQTPENLKSLQYIDLTDNRKAIDYKSDESELLNLLSNNAAYHTEHKTWLTQALKWERQQRNPTMLLRGDNLRRAENWLKVARSHSHPPTELQEQFVAESLRQPPSLSSDVFISYSRVDSDFARRLNEALQVQGKRTWFDQESIATGTDFEQEIYRGIESSDTMLFVLSPESIKSDYCAKEVEHADSLNKRIVTVLHRPFDEENLHPVLANIQRLDFRDHDGDFQINFQYLLRTLDTDREHLEAHTRLLGRALEWDRNSRDESLLLRGKNLDIAEQWLILHGDKSPFPTPLQKEYISLSRKYEKTNQRRRTAVTAIGFIISTGFAIFAGLQWRNAEIGQIRAFSESSKAKFTSNRSSLDPLLDALKAGKRLKQLPWKSQETQLETDVMSVLISSVFWVRENNRLEGHSGWIGSLNFSHDGEVIASAGEDRTIKLWQNNGRTITELRGHEDGIVSIDFHPRNSNTLVSGSLDGTIRLWRQEEEKWQEDKIWRKSFSYSTPRPVRTVSFSPDGRFIAAGGDDETIKIWQVNASQNTTPKILEGHTDVINSLSFSPDGQFIVSASNDSRIKLWRWQVGTIVSEDARIFKDDRIESVQFSPDGKYILAGSLDKGTLALWEWNGKQLIENTVFIQNKGGIESVSFSPDSKTIASAGQDNTVRLWQLDGTLITEMVGHSNYVTSLSFSPDGKTLASASQDGSIKFWNTAPKSQVLKSGSSYINGAKCSLNCNIVVAAVDTENTVNVWNKNGILVSTLSGHSARINNIDISSDGEKVATASRDNTVKLWRLNGDGLPVCPSEKQCFENLLEDEQSNGYFIDVSFSPDDAMLAATTFNGEVQIWSLNEDVYAVLKEHAHDSIAHDASFSSNGKMLASAGGDGFVKLWTAEGTLLAKSNSPTRKARSFTKVEFDFDNNRLAAASSDGSTKLWKIDHSLKKLSELPDLRHGDNRSAITSVSFNPKDRQMIIAADDTGRILIWKSDGTLIAELFGHDAYITNLSFSFDGKALMSSSDDASIILWELSEWNFENLSLDNFMILTCSLLQDYLSTNPNLNESDRRLCHGVSDKILKK